MKYNKCDKVFVFQIKEVTFNVIWAYPKYYFKVAQYGFKA